MKTTRIFLIAGLTLLPVKFILGTTLYDAAFRVHVTEEDGTPITNAEVRAEFPQFEAYPHQSKTEKYKIWTDTNGYCAFTGKCNNAISFGVFKDSYYPSLGMKFEGSSIVSGRLEPWNMLNEIQLRKIINPVPFLGRYVGNGYNPDVSIPGLAQPYGFDLQESDWVMPFGKGKIADLIMRLDAVPAQMPADYYERYPRSGKYWNTRFVVSFANPNDGFQEFISLPNIGSTFRSPRFAPKEGYVTNLIMIGNATNNVPARADLNFVFCIRSEVDDKGNVTNALYGKIYGPFDYKPSGGLKFQYLMNPTPNDRNLEFDPRQNLFKHLPRGEEPRGF